MDSNPRFGGGYSIAENDDEGLLLLEKSAIYAHGLFVPLIWYGLPRLRARFLYPITQPDKSLPKLIQYAITEIDKPTFLSTYVRNPHYPSKDTLNSIKDKLMSFLNATGTAKTRHDEGSDVVIAIGLMDWVHALCNSHHIRQIDDPYYISPIKHWDTNNKFWWHIVMR